MILYRCETLKSHLFKILKAILELYLACVLLVQFACYCTGVLISP